MSYEEISRESHPCSCGKGVIVFVQEMDDWNRTRSWHETKCPLCLAVEQKEAREAARRDAKREVALKKAKTLAKSRHLATWVKRFDGLTKKDAWFLLTDGGKEYPSLGTFYSHLKYYDSIGDYVRWSFDQDFVQTMKVAKIEDREIASLLQKADEI